MKKKYQELFGEDAEPPKKKAAIVTANPESYADLGITMVDGIFWCKLCTFNCGVEESTLKMHINGAPHNKKLRVQNQGLNPLGTTVLCEVCTVEVSRSQFDDHQNGKPHKRMLAKFSTHVTCKLCDVSFTNEMSYKTHMEGSRHNEQVNATTFCKVCKLDLETEEAYALHALGDAHKAELEKKGEAIVNKPKIIDYNNM